MAQTGSTPRRPSSITHLGISIFSASLGGSGRSFSVGTMSGWKSSRSSSSCPQFSLISRSVFSSTWSRGASDRKRSRSAPLRSTCSTLRSSSSRPSGGRSIRSRASLRCSAPTRSSGAATSSARAQRAGSLAAGSPLRIPCSSSRKPPRCCRCWLPSPLSIPGAGARASPRRELGSARQFSSRS